MERRVDSYRPRLEGNLVRIPTWLAIRSDAAGLAKTKSGRTGTPAES